VRLLGGEGYTWSTEVMEVQQRYSDARPARLRVLTADAFAAAKLSAWIDRGTPRDLYDLWAMSERRLIGPSALRVFIPTDPSASRLRRGCSNATSTRASGRGPSDTRPDCRFSAREAIAAVREARLGAAR
jgi:Nucleotidyl transferase AbiEii toxin, Type IV TA system